jgi:hypothetical protein
MKKKWWHLFYWIIITVIFLTERTILIQKAGLGYFLQCAVVRLALIISLCYFHLYVLIPRFLERRRYALYVVLLLLSVGVYVSLQNLYDIYLYGFVIGFRHYKNGDFWYPFPMNLLTTTWYLLLTTAFKLSLDWFSQRKIIHQFTIQQDEIISLKSGTQTFHIKLEDIIYVKGLKDYSLVYSRDKKLMVKGSLRAMEQLLPMGFARIHKSYIVALRHIKCNSTSKIILVDGTEIPIGRAYKDLVLY